MKKTQQLISNLIQRTVRHRRFLFIGLILIAGLALSATQWHKAQGTRAAAAFTIITVDLDVDVADALDGKCSLREAINSANTNFTSGPVAGECPAGTAGMDTITFNIGTGTPTINIMGASLPTVIEPVLIDGGTVATKVALTGAGADTGLMLNPTATGSIIRSLVISGFDNGLQLYPDNCLIENCYIGTGNRTGITLHGNNNTVGGLADGKRNVISGNIVYGLFITGNGNQIQGNYIGTDETGMFGLSNGYYGIYLAGGADNWVGGTDVRARNIISGNNSVGVQLGPNGLTLANNNHLEGNYIGLNAAGTSAIPNGTGILLQSATNTTIGGAAAGAGNVISGNSLYGIFLNGADTANNVIQGNFIGTDATGNLDLGNASNGVLVNNAPNNLVGGTSAGARNVISGNNSSGVAISSALSTGNVVQGNYIGTKVGGTVGLGNSQGVTITSAPNNTIGGAAAGARNIISGNNSSGVSISSALSTGNVVQGNYIGTNFNGTATIGNVNGVVIGGSAANNQVGGTAAGEGNLISGNNGQGVVISSSSNNRVQGNLIGTDFSGNLRLGNASNGVTLDNAPNNLVGGTSSGAGNVISGNNSSGISIGSASATGNVVQGNYIGTKMNGMDDLGNSSNGVIIASAPNNTIGGTAVGARNVISGNQRGIQVSGSTASGNHVEGNYIGTDVNGTVDLGNDFEGVFISGAPNNVIGGTNAGARNIISGNNSSGVLIFPASATGNVVQGNYIGTDASGTVDLGNSSSGVQISSAPNNTIGGTAVGAGNVISGNNSSGVLIFPASATGNVVQGNYIGTDASGTVDLGNSSAGVFISAAPNNTIGGTAAGARNIISGNQRGIQISGSTASGNRVEGNYIGTDVNGMADLGNDFEGVSINSSAANNVVGGTATEARNVISGNNGFGVSISVPGNRIEGNYIGTNAAGAGALGNNLPGVSVSGTNISVGGTAPGAGNLIAFNLTGGVTVFGGAGNAVLGNSIFGNQSNPSFANSGLGIDLFASGVFGVTPNDGGDSDAGANNLQNFPVLTSVVICSGSTIIDWTLNSAPNASFTIEFFSNSACDPSGNGEGENFIGRITTAMTDGSGNASGQTTLLLTVPAGSFITATATDSSSNTSEFSACRLAPANTPPTISGATITAQKGSVDSTHQVATASDVNQAEETLTVKVNGGTSATNDNVTVSNLSIDSAGNVTAKVSATCDATTTPTTPRTFTLTVIDNCGLSASSTLTINLAPNTKPALSYNDQTVAVGGSLLVNPATGPSDNGTFTIIEELKVKPDTGVSAAVDSVTGVVTITNITQADTYTIDVTIEDNCNQKPSAKFKVTVTASALAIRAVKHDFDGDRKSDLVDRNPETGEWRIKRSSDGELRTEQWGEASDLPVPADYDGDGKADVAVWRAADGQWLVKRSSDGEKFTAVLGEGGDTPVAADYDGDSKTDIAVWDGSEGAWHILRSSDNRVEMVSWGLASAPYFDVPVAADYDGDGKTDIAVFRRANGRWYIKQSSDGSVLERQWGVATDMLAPADYDGDGKTDIAIWRVADMNCYILRSSDNATMAISLGTAAFNDLPITGDFDGDGLADAALWRPSEALWRVKLSRDGQTMSKTMVKRATNPLHPGNTERR